MILNITKTRREQIQYEFDPEELEWIIDVLSFRNNYKYADVEHDIIANLHDHIVMLVDPDKILDDEDCTYTVDPTTAMELSLQLQAIAKHRQDEGKLK